MYVPNKAKTLVFTLNVKTGNLISPNKLVSHETVRRVDGSPESSDRTLLRLSDGRENRRENEPTSGGAILRCQRLTFGTRNQGEISMTFGGNILADNSKIVVKFPTVNQVMATRIVEMLDHIEKRVEILRESAYAIEHEKEALLSMIHTIQNNKDLHHIRQDEKEEIELTADRLIRRTLTVEVAVTTPRNDLQERALGKVTMYLDNVLDRARSDLNAAKLLCQTYLNCCLPDYQGPIDQRFQACLIECAADDQKKTRKRLESILTTLKHAKQQNDQET